MADPNNERRKAADDTDVVAHLMRAAGRRMDPPAATYERVLAAATTTWQAKVRRRRAWRLSGAVAASALVAAVVLSLLDNPIPEPVLVVGRTDRIVGTLEIETRSARRTATRGEAIELPTDAQVRTGSGSRAGIVLDGDVSLRLAADTSVVLESRSRVRVLAGTIYLDTGPSTDSHENRRIAVITPAGVASDLGTQFEVRYLEGALRLRVREGRVVLERQAATLDSAAGEELTVRSDGAVERSRIAAADEGWQWVQSVAPRPDIDGRPVTFLLTWVARETGKAVRFDRPAVERRAGTTILHGNIRDLAPLEALAAMLATTDLEHAILEDGTILIRLRTVAQR